MVRKQSPWSVEETVACLEAEIAARGLKLNAAIA